MSEYVETARFSRDDLIAVPASGPGVCAICSGPSAGPRCPRCVSSFGTVSMADVAVVPITLTDSRGAVAVALRTYKDSIEPHARDLAARKIGWLIERFLARHEHCVAGAVGALQFDVVVPVPDGAPRAASQPLAWLLAETPWVAERVHMALQPATGVDIVRGFDPGRFHAHAEAVRGRDVLVVEDLWSGGTTAMSAAMAVKLAGARTVAVLTVARMLADDPGATPELPAGAFDPRACRCCKRSTTKESVPMRAHSL